MTKPKFSPTYLPWYWIAVVKIQNIVKMDIQTIKQKIIDKELQLKSIGNAKSNVWQSFGMVCDGNKRSRLCCMQAMQPCSVLQIREVSYVNHEQT